MVLGCGFRVPRVPCDVEFSDTLNPDDHAQGGAAWRGAGGRYGEHDPKGYYFNVLATNSANAIPEALNVWA